MSAAAPPFTDHAGNPKEGDMRAAVARRLAIAFFSVRISAVVNPGLVPFSRIQPRAQDFSFPWRG